MTNKEKYLKFCTEHSDIPVFSRPWWLDVVSPGKWDVVLIERNDTIIASFPYQFEKRRFFSYINMPLLTQKLGPYIIYDSNKASESKRIGYEHEIYNKIITLLPRFGSFSINFDWKYKNWLPFYWMKFKQTSNYTYILDDISNMETIRKNYSKSKKQPLQKAKEFLELQFDLPKNIFYDYFINVINDRGKNMGFQKDLFDRIYDAIYEHNAGRVFYCTDKSGNIHAINMIVWDSECAYYLLAMRNRQFNTSGGTEFLVDEVINYVSQFVNKFDFEGSMIKGVEESYRHYGSKQIEYYNISKCANPLLRIRRMLKNE